MTKTYSREEIEAVLEDTIPGQLSAIIRQLLDEREWRDMANAPRDGQVILSYWHNMPVFIACVKDEWHVLMNGRDEELYMHGNYAPFNPPGWHPLPPPPMEPADAA